MAPVTGLHTIGHHLPTQISNFIGYSKENIGIYVVRVLEVKCMLTGTWLASSGDKTPKTCL